MRTLVKDTLKQLEPEIKYSLDAENLILGTIAQESAYGKYRRQLGGGPALGITEMEPATFNDILTNYLKYKPALKEKITRICHVGAFSAIDLINNDKLAICMCRVHYLRVKYKLPTSLIRYAAYWKLFYNTRKGKGTMKEFVHNYKFYVLGEPLV